MNFKRVIIPQIEKDLQKKMVLLAGPRQSGKTTIAKQIIKEPSHYLNWDDGDDRSMILERKWPTQDSILALDEIHKFKRWRNLLKGLYDKLGDNLKILVTGSAKLGFYHHGGDSLQGRYFFHRLHPLTIAELKITTQKDLEDLLVLSGFPEPFFSSSLEEKKRWSRQYRSLLVREDLRDLEQITSLGLIEQLAMRLPSLVASPLSLNAIREDLQVAHKTISKWCDALERLYYFFRLSPFGSPKIRAIKKLQKHYHYDWSLPDKSGARFENFIACHIWKWCQFMQDTKGEEIDLRYFRDVDGREVDFIVTKDNEPIIAVEAKISSDNVDSGLKYFKKKYSKVKAYQVELNNNKRYTSEQGIEVLSALDYLQSLV